MPEENKINYNSIINPILSSIGLFYAEIARRKTDLDWLFYPFEIFFGGAIIYYFLDPYLEDMKYCKKLKELEK
jgi:hypothetical protein